jgi:hypothetical protein
MLFPDNRMFRVTYNKMFPSGNKMVRVNMDGSTDYFSSKFSIDGPILIDEYNVIRNLESEKISYVESGKLSHSFEAALPQLRKDLKYGEEINDLIDLSTLSLGNKNRIQQMRNWNRKNLEDQSAWVLKKQEMDIRKRGDSTLKEVRYHSLEHFLFLQHVLNRCSFRENCI